MNRSNHGVIFRSKTTDEEGDKLIIKEKMFNGSQSVSQSGELMKVVYNRRITFFKVEI